MKGNKTFKFNLSVAILTFLAQVGLACSPFVPLTAGIWHANSTQDFYNNIAAFVGTQLLLLTTAVTLMTMKGAQDQNDALSEMLSALPLTVVKRLTDSQFYIQFRSAVEEAHHSVRIAYLAPYPPEDVPYKYRKKYDEEILELMKKRTDVTFKRLIRASPRNDAWVADLIRRLQGRPNIEISLLTRDLPPEENMPLALSVQVVDHTKVWLVAVAAHEIEADFRDIYIENADVTAGLCAYYDRIWDTSMKVLNRGNVTAEGDALLRRVEQG